MKVKKTKKSTKMRGRGSGSHGRGFRKRGRGKGDRGGKGMSGTGKRADHKKTLVNKLYGNDYFGKQGITSRGTKRDKSMRINLREIILNLENFIKKGIAKKTTKGFEVDLKKHKILGDGEVKEKFVITAQGFSKMAEEKVKKAGGEIIVPKGKKE